jgi:hypothetical protein
MTNETKPPPRFTLQEMVEFLCGEDPLDGVWFGDLHPTEPGKFWWRKHLRAAAAEARIPPGWTIRRKDRKPFKTIELSVEHDGARYSTHVSSHEMNPANILYMLAEALLGEEVSGKPTTDS